MRAAPRTRPVGVYGDDEASPVQILYLKEIAGFHQCNGYAPNLRELALAVGGASPHGASEMLIRLSRKGFVTFEPRIARTVRLTPRGLEQLKGLADE